MALKKNVNKPFFHFEPLAPWDVISMWMYGVFTLLLVIVNFCGSADSKPVLLIIYAISFQLLIFFFSYRLLRNLKSYLIWFSFSLIHLFFYFVFRRDHDYDMRYGSVVNILINTSLLLLLFQGLRFMSIKFQGLELVVPARGGKKDLFNERKVTFFDYLFLFVYILSWFGLSYLQSIIHDK